MAFAWAPPGALQARAPPSASSVGCAPPVGRGSRRHLPWTRGLCAALGTATAGLRQRSKRFQRSVATLDPLAGVPETAWPLLQRAEAADPRCGLQRVAAGLLGWRQALESGKVWEEADGANWPERSLRLQWAKALQDLKLLRFTKRYPELIDPLLHRLLEMAVQLAEASFGAASEESSSKGESPQASASSKAGGEASPGADADQGDESSGSQEQPQQGAEQKPSTTGQESQDVPEPDSLQEELVREFQEEWAPTVEALNEAEESFGFSGAKTYASSFTSQGAPWRRSQGWESASGLRSVLKQMRTLRDLVRSLGRRTALRGPRHRLPVEFETLAGAQGVAQSLRAPTEVAGVARTGSLELMLPSEAVLFVRGRRKPTLRALHHARHVERSLLGYNRASWLEVPTQELRSEESRPADENGPIILCLDTSGSMTRSNGAPETFAKAIVFECLRQAHRQARRCCLFAFSSGAELQQLELDLSTAGLGRLLEFLQYAFHGGTSLEEVIRASVERLESSRHWRNADILLVTDGEVPEPTSDVVEALRTAREDCGARVYGIVVGSKTGRVMANLCGELYKLSRRCDRPLAKDKPLDPREWKLRCVQGRAKSALWAVAALPPVQHGARRAAFVGVSMRAEGILKARRPCTVAGHLTQTCAGPAERELVLDLRYKEEHKAAGKDETQHESASRKRRRWSASARGNREIDRRRAAEQRDKIEYLLRESRLRDARLELWIKRRAQLQPFETSDLEVIYAAAASDPVIAVAAKWADDYLSHCGQELLSILVLASREAARMGQLEFDTDAVLLGFFASPRGAALCRKGLPPSLAGRDPVEAARAAVEAVVRDTIPDDLPKRSGPDLPISRVLRLLLEATEAERVRLGHELAEPEHLLLALASSTFASGAWEALQALGVDPSRLRLGALESLGDFLATAQCSAEAWLIRRCADSSAAARPSGPPVAGLREAHAAITDGLVERSVEAKLLLLAALSGEHLFLLGSPGTAKSLVARRLAGVCSGSFFERLLTRFSVPEEIFGPLSLQALEQDELRRKTQGYLPEADVAFIDEIFKANSSILNTLLLILNERCFDNGHSRMQVNLWCAVAASNELPDTEELDALYDRFLLRRCVRRVSPEAVARFLRMSLDVCAANESDRGDGSATASTSTAPPPLSAAASVELQARSRDVEFPDRLLRVVAELREHLAHEAEPPFVVSDRRLGKAVRLLRVAAASVGAARVVEADLLLLRHVLWDRSPEQGELVVEWLLERFVEDSCGQRAWTFLLEGLRRRLRFGLEGEALTAARSELSSLSKAATAALGMALRVAQDAPSEGRVEDDDRFFWLSPEERSRAACAGERAAEGAAALRELLVESSVLAEVAGVEDGARRKDLLMQLLGGSSDVEAPREVLCDYGGDPI